VTRSGAAQHERQSEMPMNRWTFVIGVVLAFVAADVRPEEAPKRDTPSSDPQLLDYARRYPACTAFTDLCQTCIRGSDRNIQCSTPGIACVRQPWSCTSPETQKR
jgi:hypothetical protein